MAFRASRNPLIFIGSSDGSRDVASALQRNLANRPCGVGAVADVQIWNQGFFGVGEAALSALVEKAKECDFAVLVFGQDSIVTERGKPHDAPGDNVWFDLGLFFGAIGPHRTFIVHEDGVKFPSNLAGPTVGTFGRPQGGSLQGALSAAATSIRERIQDVISREPRPIHKLTLSDQYARWWDAANTSRTEKEIIPTTEGLEIEVSQTTFSPDVRLTYSPRVVYKRLPRDMTHKRVLDLGTGCGILAIAAALRGAREVIACDISHSAIEDTQRNVERLVAEGRIRADTIKVVESNLFDNVTGKFDYILANLPIAADAESWEGLGDSVENIIKSCISGLKDHLKVNGVAIFVWASFGPPSLIPDLLRSAHLDWSTYHEDTFGARWFAYVARHRRKLA